MDAAGQSGQRQARMIEVNCQFVGIDRLTSKAILIASHLVSTVTFIDDKFVHHLNDQRNVSLTRQRVAVTVFGKGKLCPWEE